MHACRHNNNPSIDRLRSAVLQNKFARIEELLKEEAEEDHSREICLDENGEPACSTCAVISIIMLKRNTLFFS